ncbi:type II toxin-antitoxin system RelE/ParE family toxin [Enterobacter sp. ENT03]|uniref:type II toxin-antitoxin system RelE/ParE family toxin n=1 Tax=Enterobacter sp. ENT03 TaxID=2854780 RepID=UPI001C475C7D|nr:type II toxin-antitoxin system RelE/ParE family toxin [Enterobacter sp. ENT03]
MAYYKTRLFKRKTKHTSLSDESLLKAAKEVESGQHDGDLGGGVIKKRIAIKNAGKRGGARTIIFFKSGSHVFFVDGWEKKDVPKSSKEIEEDELETYKDLASAFLNYNEANIAALIEQGILSEVKEVK